MLEYPATPENIVFGISLNPFRCLRTVGYRRDCVATSDAHLKGYGRTVSSTWTELLVFESVDLVKRSFKNRHNRELNTGRATEIVAQFTQAREYFDSAAASGPLVKPLLVYYGVVALSRGAILLLNGRIDESGLAQAHGIQVQDWRQTFSAGLTDTPDLQIQISSGTFMQLLQATANSDRAEIQMKEEVFPHVYSLTATLPQPGALMTLKDIAARIPDLHDLYIAVVGEQPRVYPLTVHVQHPGTFTELQFEETSLGFPPAKRLREDFGFQQTITQGETDFVGMKRRFLRVHLAHRDGNWHEKLPHLMRDRKGRVFAVAPLAGASLSKLALLYALSYILGMFVRYYPTQWRALALRGAGDLFAPIVAAGADLVAEEFPQTLLEQLMTFE